MRLCVLLEHHSQPVHLTLWAAVTRYILRVMTAPVVVVVMLLLLLLLLLLLSLLVMTNVLLTTNVFVI
jgi:hypothetical protein